MTKPHLYSNATIVKLPAEGGFGLVHDGIIAVDDGTIDFVGRKMDLPVRYEGMPQTTLGGRLVTAGLIDCHTHLIYGGSRAHEFEMRLNGASYEEITRAGGGIFSTVEATRSASDEELITSALARVDAMIKAGATTIEVKSGYGLDIDTELRMLRIARALEKERPVRIKTTFLGAHAIPKGISGDDYLDQFCLPALKAASHEGLVDAVDGFCEGIAFSVDQIRRVFDVANELGLSVKLHAEQLSNLEGAALAASFDALSIDHLEYLSNAGVAAMAEKGSVAVLLPGAFYFLGETKVPPVQSLRDAGVPMAVATDCNPGSSPMTSLPLAMNMAATLFGLTPEECLRGVTTNATKALGLNDVGQLAHGQKADFAIWDLHDPAEITYRIGDAPLWGRVFGGTLCRP